MPHWGLPLSGKPHFSALDGGESREDNTLIPAGPGGRRTRQFPCGNKAIEK